MQLFRTFLVSLLEILAQESEFTKINNITIKDWHSILTSQTDALDFYKLEVPVDKAFTHVSIVFYDAKTINGLSFLTELSELSSVRFLLCGIEGFANVDFNAIPSNICFKHMARFLFTNCVCERKVKKQFLLPTEHQNFIFTNCTITNEFLSNFSVRELVLLQTTGLKDCSHLTKMSNFKMAGSIKEHFVESFNHVPSLLKVLVIEFSENHNLTELPCLTNLHKHITAIGSIQITIGAPIVLPLLNFVIIRSNGFRLNNLTSSVLLNQCEKIINDHRLTQTHNTVLQAQEEMIEIGAGKFAKL